MFSTVGLYITLFLGSIENLDLTEILSKWLEKKVKKKKQFI